MFAFLKKLFSKEIELPTGALLDVRKSEQKINDIAFQEIVATASPVTWVTKTQYRTFPPFNQFRTLSCGAHALAKALGIAYNAKYGAYLPFSRAHIYQRRITRAGGMALWEMFDILGAGVTLEQLTPEPFNTDEDIDKITIEQFKKDVGSIFKVTGGIYLPSDIEQIASVIQTTGKGVILLTYFLSKEWSSPSPIIQNRILGVNDPSALKHFVCFTPESMILTENGYKKISDIVVDELVLTHKNRFRKVNKILKRKYNGEIVIFKSKNGIGEIGATPEHPILKREINIKTQHTLNTINQGLNKFNYEPASSITKNSVFINGILPTRKILLNANKAFLLGAYVGDGNIGNKYSVRFCLGKTKKESGLQQRIIKYMFNEFKALPHIYKVKNQNSIQLVFFNQKSVKFFSEWGGLPGKKNIKQSLLFANNELLDSFLKGWICTDGSYGIRVRPIGKKCEYQTLFTAEKNLAYSLKLILDKLNISYSRVERKSESVVRNGITWNSKGGITFYMYKKTTNNQIKYKDGKQIMRNDFYKKQQYNGFVYNLEVDEDNTYIVDGVTVHNCAVDYTLINGVKYLIIEDSAWFGGYNRRTISEDWVKNRVIGAGYPMNFKFIVGTGTRPTYDGWTITSVQQCLRYEGLFPSNVSYTENVGPITRKALSDFQTKYGLPVTGQIDTNTKMKLKTLYP